MPSVLRKVFGRFRLCVPPRGEHGADKDLQPAQSVGRTQTPTPATEALVLELAEERARRVRLEQECQMTKVEANAFAEARTQKLEYEIREVRRLLEQRGEELGQKDASIQRLENEAIEVQAKLAELQTAVAHSRELSARLSERDKSLSTANTAIKELEFELAEERARRARVEQQYQIAKVEENGYTEARGKSEDEVLEVRELLKKQEEELAHKDKIIQRLETEAIETQEKLAESRTAAAGARELSARLAEKDKLLSQRTMELSAAEAFLIKVDGISVAEVVDRVKYLNTLICSASGALSDVWDQREPVPGTLAEEPDLKETRDNFGNSMFEQITARNELAVTLTVETYLSQFIERVTSGWGSGEVAETLGQIYGMISVKESQTIASRWRALTRRYVPHQEPPRGEEIISDLARILMLTRSFSSLAEATEAVRVGAGTEVQAIIEATVRFDKDIKTKIVSSDMSIYVVPPGATFTEDTMTDDLGEDETREEGGLDWIVAGTMEVGLRQRTALVEEVLRKPKVILEHSLHSSATH